VQQFAASSHNQTVAQQVITLLLKRIATFGYKAIVHVELEGVYETANAKHSLDFEGVNKTLLKLGINGELKTEFWHQQWEYVSLFNGQSPLKEAQDLASAMRLLPIIMRRFGAEKVLLKPVAWAADKGRYVPGSGAIFSTDTRSVHIPNAIQMNVSVADDKGNNLIPSSTLGEWIQHHLLTTSLACCALFLPEEDAFKRLALRTEYGLDAELSSPFLLSGGHQGSIALYKEVGKHNQLMGQEPLLYGANNQVLSYSHDWHKTARVEHRIGATSDAYDPFLNMIFILLNVLQGIESWQSTDGLPPTFASCAFPSSLHDAHLVNGSVNQGALTLFNQQHWFAHQVDRHCQEAFRDQFNSVGQKLHAEFLARYLPALTT
tara:strand:+ start:11167 stop:12294 length:1128 start_codon:yes stop_codon:yes gene_type:complete